MKLFIFTAIGGALLLSGCAGTSSDFECNATTSDTCMTMHEANDKAKLKEEGGTAVKPDAGALPRLAEGSFSATSSVSAPPSYPLPTPVIQSTSRNPFSGKSASVPVTTVVPTPVMTVSAPVAAPRVTPMTARSVVAPEYPRPLRVGERTAQLWIAPYIDTADVYHQPSTVMFVVTPSRWGQPRIR